MYIQLVSLHGLIRGEHVEMGRDADTGGQVRYVLELARTLAASPGVESVDLFTRRIRDRRVSDDYGRAIEELGPGLRLVRLPCGGGRYLRKERLWPHLDEYVDAMLDFTRHGGRSPSVVHGHYADAGYVAREVAAAIGAPFVFTGHSLGKPKREYLLREGWTQERLDEELAIGRRIEVEQDCIDAADLIVTSTRHERDVQYAGYQQPMGPRFEVIPPGTDLDRFFPYYEYDFSGSEIDERFKQARVRMQMDLQRFFYAHDKPLILALCRPDRRKNIGALIEAYGESPALQAIANLAVFAGIRDDIGSMPDNERHVLTDMLLAMDRYNLYGKMAIPKQHGSEFDVPELYRLAASSRGVFANTAFNELFGLTAIEASAVGLPFVATEDGGPRDIVENCASGLTINVRDRQAITDALLTLLTDARRWEECSSSGVNRVREHYTWRVHCDHYLARIRSLANNGPPAATTRTGRRLAGAEWLLLSDIDNTLLGDDDALSELLAELASHRQRVVFGVATGRSPEKVREALHRFGIEGVDVVIASVGAEVYYGPDFTPDRGWAARLRARWKRDRVREALSGFPWLRPQEGPDAQRDFKVSYDLVAGADPEESIAAVRLALTRARVAHTLIFSHGTFIDVLPQRASKGKAAQYVAQKWGVPLSRVVTAGDSGNDADMLRAPLRGVVVANHDAELAGLRDASHAYFADAPFAAGVLEGLRHYGALPPAREAGTPRAASA